MRFSPGEGRSLGVLRGLALATLCTMLVGCNPKTVWSTKAVSPDGEWIAGARTQTWSGPGIATAASSVYLVRARDPGKPKDIVSYMEGDTTPRPQIAWRSSNELVVYVPYPDDLNLQAIKFADIRILVEPIKGQVSGANSTNPLKK